MSAQRRRHARRRPNEVRGTLTANSYALWAFRRVAARRFGDDDGRTVEWAMEFVLSQMQEDDLKRRGIDFAAFERANGIAPLLEHTAKRPTANVTTSEGGA